MEVVLAVLRPKQNLGNQEYRHRLYDILLLDGKPSSVDSGKPEKYLPMFSTDSLDDVPREAVLTEVFKVTGGLKGWASVMIFPLISAL